MERCFICYRSVKNIIYLPDPDEHFGEIISIFKNIFIIKDIDNFKFLYYHICPDCIDNYLKYYGKTFKYLRNRELGIKS